ncbi:ribosomal protein S2, flavodoxin-like domain-containing protein [Crucibulum laeve]|uniref:Ribosomal protein S2, flavodoxin-like domain-containing protein n=1 Tax=Crucibulum laeve TaxID=68775 RepID=A0A5C3MDV3_9AGAR|nr:ribosomal protein S2, flavodoxin-like domain-containing protein [Crucibulum laeve]
MSLQPAIRPWLAASARCSSSIIRSNVSPTLTRYQSTDTSKRLETVQDWQQFQSTRQDVSDLIHMMTPFGSTQNDKTTFHLRDSLRRPPAEATISSLLAAGAHFGHASTRMNPNFVPYAYGTRAGITIIDLDHTLPLLRRAAQVVRAVARAGGQILFIGTRPDIRPVVQRASERLGSQGYHVGDRWLPGTLTNQRQFFGDETVDSTKTVPDLVVLLNPLQNIIAIRECALEHVPTIGIIDSNVDPRIVMYPIPANDESTRAAELIGGVLSIAGREGVALREAQLMKASRREQSRRPGPR